MEDNIEFHVEDTDFEVLHPDEIRMWVNSIAAKHKHNIHHLSIIFCSDERLLEMNKEFLQHDYYTDILTFPHHPEGSKEIIGDLHISVDRVQDFATTNDVSFVDELHRVIIHGLLHLCKLDDQSDAEKERMRREENLALSLRMF